MEVKVSIMAKRNNTRRICNNIFIFAIEFERKTQTDIFFRQRSVMLDLRMEMWETSIKNARTVWRFTHILRGLVYCICIFRAILTASIRRRGIISATLLFFYKQSSVLGLQINFCIMKEIGCSALYLFLGIYGIISQIASAYYLYQYYKIDSFAEILLIDWWLAEIKGILWIIFIWL